MPNDEIKVAYFNYAILSHHFVRFATVPWQPKILAAPLRAIQAEHRFKQLYGAASAGWRVTVSDGAYGAPMLAAASEEDLLAELRQITTKHKTRVSVIEPWGVTPLNAFRKQLWKHSNGALALVEEGKLVLLLFRGTALAGVTARRGDGGVVGQVGAIVNQEALALGLADLEERTFIARCDQGTTVAPDIVALYDNRPVIVTS